MKQPRWGLKLTRSASFATLATSTAPESSNEKTITNPRERSITSLSPWVTADRLG